MPPRSTFPRDKYPTFYHHMSSTGTALGVAALRDLAASNRLQSTLARLRAITGPHRSKPLGTRFSPLLPPSVTQALLLPCKNNNNNNGSGVYNVTTTTGERVSVADRHGDVQLVAGPGADRRDQRGGCCADADHPAHLPIGMSKSRVEAADERGGAPKA